MNTKISLLLLSLASTFAFYSCQKQDNSILEKWTETSVPILEENGFKYRDLNKNTQLDKYEDRRLPISERVNDLMSQMTIEEKAGQMFHPFMSFPRARKGKEIDSVTVTKAAKRKRKAFQRTHISHYAVAGAAKPRIMAIWHNKIQQIAEQNRLSIPITFSTDPRHGFRDQQGVASVKSIGFSQWCEPLGFGAMDDEALTKKFGEVANQEYRAVGIRTALHPMADLATEPRWGRIIGTFGEDADVSARMTSAYIKGFQGETFGKNSVSCMTKHFSGAGPQLDGWDAHFSYGRDQIYPGNNFEYHLKPFAAAIKARANQMMPYYAIPVGQGDEDVAFGFNKKMLTDLLRNKMGFKGVICSDWNIAQMRPWGVDSLKVTDRYIKSIDAGVDQFGGESHPENVVTIVNEGAIPESRIDESVRRILEIKFQMGLFDEPFLDIDTVDSIVGKPEFIEAGNLSQRKSQVLLKNEDKILPLKKGTKIFTVNIDSITASKYGEVVSTPEKAEVVLLKLVAPYEKDRKGILENIIHQGSLSYTEQEKAEILDLIEKKPSVISMYMERPAVVPEIIDKSNAFIAYFGASNEALLDVIFGEFTPQGKLPFELPSSLTAVENQKEDLPHDSENPIFNYGFGLSY